MSAEIEILKAKLSLLRSAVSNQRSVSYCLKLWGAFIRSRDGDRCVICDSPKSVSAHHIFRKSFLAGARFETGNGITLCVQCHKKPHDTFNRKPNLQLPMDAEGGEKIELALRFLDTLFDDAKTRKLLRDDFYFFSDSALRTFKKFQSIDPDLAFPGTRLEQAWLIWAQTPRCTMNAILEANGFNKFPTNFIQIAVTIIYDE